MLWKSLFLQWFQHQPCIQSSKLQVHLGCIFLCKHPAGCEWSFSVEAKCFLRAPSASCRTVISGRPTKPWEDSKSGSKGSLRAAASLIVKAGASHSVHLRSPRNYFGNTFTPSVFELWRWRCAGAAQSIWRCTDGVQGVHRYKEGSLKTFWKLF